MSSSDRLEEIMSEITVLCSRIIRIRRNWYFEKNGLDALDPDLEQKVVEDAFLRAEEEILGLNVLDEDEFVLESNALPFLRSIETLATDPISSLDTVSSSVPAQPFTSSTGYNAVDDSSNSTTSSHNLFFALQQTPLSISVAPVAFPGTTNDLLSSNSTIALPATSNAVAPSTSNTALQSIVGTTPPSSAPRKPTDVEWDEVRRFIWGSLAAKQNQTRLLSTDITRHIEPALHSNTVSYYRNLVERALARGAKSQGLNGFVTDYLCLLKKQGLLDRSNKFTAAGIAELARRGLQLIEHPAV